MFNGMRPLVVKEQNFKTEFHVQEIKSKIILNDMITRKKGPCSRVSSKKLSKVSRRCSLCSIMGINCQTRLQTLG